MNRPPAASGPDRGRGPDVPWYQRRPAADDPTRIARPRPPQQHPRPAPKSPPPAAERPAPDPEIPWYLQRPDRPTRHSVPEKPPPSTQPTRADSADRKALVVWILAGVGVLVVLIGVAVLLANLSSVGFAGGTVLDVTKVQAGVLATLSDPASGYGANTVTDVSCNGGRNPSAAKGTTFVCDAVVNAVPRHVSVLVSDENGTYEIDRPR
jgi:hypothetical protein